MDEQNLERRILAAAELRAVVREEIDTDANWIKDEFSLSVDAAERYRAIKERQEIVLKSARTVAAAPLLGIEEQLGAALRLDRILKNTEERIDVYVASLYTKLDQELGKEPPGLEEGVDLLRQQEPVLEALGRLDATKELHALLTQATIRTKHQAAARISRGTLTSQLSERALKLEQELARYTQEYDLLKGTVTNRDSHERIEKYVANVTTAAHLASSLEQSAQEMKNKSLKEQTGLLVRRAERLEQDALLLEGQATAYAQRHRKNLLSKGAVAAGIATLVIGAASLVYGIGSYVSTRAEEPRRTAPLSITQPPIAAQLLQQEYAQRQQPRCGTNTTLERVIVEEKPSTILYVSRERREGILYEVNGESCQEVLRAPCTLARREGNKQHSGDNRTQEGVFHVESDAIVQGARDPLYGAAFLNLEDKPFPGLQVTGTDLPERIRAIEQRKDSTNGAVTFRNQDAVRIIERMESRGVGQAIVVIEDGTRPLYR